MNDILTFFKDMFGNFYLMSVACSWILAQIIKISTMTGADSFEFSKFAVILV